MARAIILSSCAGFGLGIAVLAAPAIAGDTAKLSIYQPLTLQDAYPTSTGTVQVQSSASWDETKDGKDLVIVRPVVKWGAFEHFQLSVGAPYRLGNASSSYGGDPFVGVFYQLTEDKDGTPAIAVSQSVHQYYGTLQGTEPNTTLLVTKSLTGDRNGTEVHLNLSYRHHFDGASDDRTDRTRIVVGVSQPLGENLTILADYVRQEDRQVGDLTNLVEAGFRHQLGKDDVFSLGAGIGIGADSRRARVLIGLQHAIHTW